MMFSFVFAVAAFSVGIYFWLTMFPTSESFAIASMGDLLVLATLFLMGAIFLTGAFIATEIDLLRRLIKKRWPEKNVVLDDGQQ
ncbi:MAG: hypothetical protein PVH42_13645 [Desulfobacterales bacterium]|jgi:hypothetical protein